MAATDLGKDSHDWARDSMGAARIERAADRYGCGPVAFVLSGQMACAYFIGHMFEGGIAAPAFTPLLNGGNAAILFCFACLYLACTGGGPWSADAVRRK